jgi:transposase
MAPYRRPVRQKRPRQTAPVSTTKDAGCLLLRRAHRLPLAHAAQGSAALAGRVRAFPSLDGQESVRDDARQTACDVASARGTKRGADGGGDRPAVGQDLSAGRPKGFDAGKKVKGRKRHLVVDVLGLALAVLVHPANVQDRDGAAPVVRLAVEKCPTIKKLYVDAAHSGECAQSLRQHYKLDVEVVRRPGAAGTWSDAQLPLFAVEAKPFPILPRRWVVERTHSWVERPRRLSKDYDRRLDVATSWIWLAETRILLRRLSEAESV